MTFFATPSKRAAFFAAIFLLASIPAFAQITITSTEFEQAFSQYGATTTFNDAGAAGLQTIVNQSGANQSWNFQALPFVLDTTAIAPTSTIAYSANLPGADSFPSATAVQISSSGGDSEYDFYEINQSGYYILGSSVVYNGGTPSISVYSPPLQELVFPLTYQTSWASTTTATQAGFPFTLDIEDSVDSWGTFSLPGNISAQALRIREKITSLSSFGNTVSYSFGWISPAAYTITIDADSNQNATDANYSVPSGQNIVSNNAPSSQFSISAASNPISSPTNVSFTLPSESQVRISLMDALGRQSQVLMNGMAHTGVNTLSLDPATLMNGTYFIRIESAGNSAMQKVIVNH